MVEQFSLTSVASWGLSSGSEGSTSEQGVGVLVGVLVGVWDGVLVGDEVGFEVKVLVGEAVGL